MLKKMLALLVLSLLTFVSFVGSSTAAVVYTVGGAGRFSGSTFDFSFVLTRPNFISGAGLSSGVLLDSCVVADGLLFSCSKAGFSASPNIFGGLNDVITVTYESGAGVGTGYLLFIAGAFGAEGTYVTRRVENLTPGYENFGSATLVVSGSPSVVPLPAGGLLLIGALAALGLVRRWRP